MEDNIEADCDEGIVVHLVIAFAMLASVFNVNKWVYCLSTSLGY